MNQVPGIPTETNTNELLFMWLKTIHDEQIKQTKYLRNISIVATIFGLALVLVLTLGIFGFLFGLLGFFV